jgi:hypothetical protein
MFLFLGCKKHGKRNAKDSFACYLPTEIGFTKFPGDPKINGRLNPRIAESQENIEAPVATLVLRQGTRLPGLWRK